MSNISSIDWQTWTNEQLDPIAKQLLMNRKTEWVLPFMLAYVHYILPWPTVPTTSCPHHGLAVPAYDVACTTFD